MMNFQKTKLDNGLEIIAEINDQALSTAMGFFVRTGARDESDEIAGVSHFLEHMAFKGSERRTAADVNRELDELGGVSNAFTSEELTAFYIKVLPELQEPLVHNLPLLGINYHLQILKVFYYFLKGIPQVLLP